MDTILAPLEYGVSWALLHIHSFLVWLGLPADSGLSWGPSIVILVVLVRILLIPLFVRQIRAQRGLQLLQPRMQELRKKYGSDRQKMSEELMKLYQETGTNPFSSCLPIVAQSPFFFGLYRVLDAIARDHPRGFITEDVIASAQKATIFGAPIPDSFLNPTPGTTTLYVTVIMIVMMCTTQFITQRQVMLKNMPGGGANPMAQQQKILLYVFPLIFAASGLYFPVGVLLYWLTTNLWTMGQQFYVIRRMPAPGSKAEEAMHVRRAERAKAKEVSSKGAVDSSGTSAIEPATPPPPPRQQPKRQSRSQRKGPAPVSPPRTGGNPVDPPGAASGGDTTGNTAQPDKT